VALRRREPHGSVRGADRPVRDGRLRDVAVLRPRSQRGAVRGPAPRRGHRLRRQQHGPRGRRRVRRGGAGNGVRVGGQLRLAGSVCARALRSEVGWRARARSGGGRRTCDWPRTATGWTQRRRRGWPGRSGLSWGRREGGRPLRPRARSVWRPTGRRQVHDRLRNRRHERWDQAMPARLRPRLGAHRCTAGGAVLAGGRGHHGRRRV
jgi:hypothetical protein